MRILQFNILDGCQGDPDRLRDLGSWLSSQAFDLVGLNELNGWDTPPDIAARAGSWGYPSTALVEAQSTPYLIGAMAKHPITKVGDVTDGFHHGVLVLEMSGIHVVITHLTPLRADDREGEATRLARIVGEIDGPMLLMGDFNTLSPLDREWHERDGLVNRLRSDELLARKFLTDRQEINYRPMQTLLDTCLVDLCREPMATVPTAASVDPAHAVPMRIDYIMGNRAFVDGFGAAATVLHDPPLSRLSDHYPVLCEW